jgi:polyhydroxyalkanoate synthesis regulator phasin|tara:strand:+ start:323 stop:499 length:177 start_codon:yes stop_codon:yes gene_type:complete
MFNPFGMGKDLKGMEKMVKPALEKFMKESGFVKQEELDKALERIESLEEKLSELEERV